MRLLQPGKEKGREVFVRTDGRAGVVGAKARELAYGENRRQTYAAQFVTPAGRDDILALDKLVQLCGSTPGTVNVLDLHRLLETATRTAAAWELNFEYRPKVALFVKHGNTGGMAVGEEEATVVKKMLEGDPEAVFGGSVSTNFPITAEIARLLRTHATKEEARVLDIIAAPSFDTDAMEVLERKAGLCKMFTNEALGVLGAQSIDATPRLKQVRGGFIITDGDPYVFVIPPAWKEKLPPLAQHDLVLAWAIGSTSNSNTITIVKNRMLIGNGVGQRSRVMAAKLALLYAKTYGHDVRGAVAYSDSFFPFPDGPTVLAKAGIKTIFATSGSIRDLEIERQCETMGVRMLQLPDAEARGFYGHC